MPPSRTPKRAIPRTPQDPEGYYARLGVAPSSDAASIAAAWRREARVVHPDVPETGDAAAFLELKQAYDVLSHATTRAAYDRSARRAAAWDPGAGDLGFGASGFAGTGSDASGPGESGSDALGFGGAGSGASGFPGAGGGDAGSGESGAGRSWFRASGFGTSGFGGLDASPLPEISVPPTRHPRLRDLPTAVWAGMAVVVMIGVLEIGLRLTASPTGESHATIAATAPDVPPLAPNDPAASPYGPAPRRLAGTPNFYVVPTAAAAMLWKVDEAKHILVPWDQLPAFSAVQALRLLKPSGMVEVKVTDTANGYIDAARLTPGDTAAAARAWCTYNAGPTPANGEVLSHAGKGGARMVIDNRSGQLAVVKVRSAAGAVLASVFVGPGGATTLDGLPEQPVEVDFATGEVWSRACRGFAAGMRAARLTGLVSIGQAPRLAIPPDAAVATADLSDQAFERE